MYVDLTGHNLIFCGADIQPARGWNGTYNEEMFTGEAERLIAKHAAGLRSGEIAAAAGFYLYLAYHNVHGATNDNAAQQAPQATVDLYNTTKLDTYKVAGTLVPGSCRCMWLHWHTSVCTLWPPSICFAGAMITKLDDGVGAVRAALEKAGMLSNSVIAFCSDNGGPLDHATNMPLRGGKERPTSHHLVHSIPGQPCQSQLTGSCSDLLQGSTRCGMADCE